MSNSYLSRKEELSRALARMQANPRVLMIRLSCPHDCALAQTVAGTYEKDAVPELPREGCPRPGGCICVYEPVLGEIFP